MKKLNPVTRKKAVQENSLRFLSSIGLNFNAVILTAKMYTVFHRTGLNF